MEEPNLVLQNRWQRFSFILALLALGIASLGLAGWFFHSPALHSGFGTSGTIKFNSSLCLFLAGLAIIYLRLRKVSLARFLSLIIFIITVVTLLEYIFNQDWGIDQLFFQDPDTNSNLEPPGRMSLLTAVNLSGLSLALLALSYRQFSLGQLLTAFLFILAYASFLGHLFDITRFYQFGRFSTIAGHTALALVFINLSLLLVRSDSGWMKTFSSPYMGGKLARLSFAYFMLTVPLFMGIYLFGLKQWQFTPASGLTSSFLVICFITIPIAYIFLYRLNNLDAALQQANQSLQQSNANLAGRNTELSKALNEVRAVNEELANLAQEIRLKSLTLEQRNQELISINQGLDDIVYMASHDLKTPINNLMGIFGELRSMVLPSLPPEDQQLIILGEDSVKRLKRTIEDLTQIIRSQQIHKEAPEPVLLSSVLQEIKVELNREIAASGAQVNWYLQTDEILFSRIHLRSILFNLVSNALKYRSPERVPEVNISAEPVLQGVQIIVADNGLGLTENQQEKLFSIFKRFHSHVEGSGIGLYIVKRILENYGGRIQVSSRVSSGTNFTIFIPQNF
ncbi:MAG: HAMP domain-containing histidine kinase [Bacteroidota bacterium]|nr:HAMP domain-containing histidine kinase [Bacteroidota bacterium]